MQPEHLAAQPPERRAHVSLMNSNVEYLLSMLARRTSRYANYGRDEAPPPSHSRSSVAKVARRGTADRPDVCSEHADANGRWERAARGNLQAARRALYAGAPETLL